MQTLGCMKPILLAVRAALVSGNHFERFINICERIRGALKCIRHIPGKCSQESGTRFLIANFQYFCEDNYPVIAVITVYKHMSECLDIYSSVVQRECQWRCQETRQVLSWFLYGYMRSTVLATISEETVPSKLNADYFRRISGDTCRMVMCYMTCLREKYNVKCNGIGGSMFVEAIFRPLIALHRSWPYSPIANSMGLIMPPECNFLTRLESLNEFRLVKTTDAPIQLLKSVISPLDDDDFASYLTRTPPTTENDESKIHTEETEEAIENFKSLDRLQRMKP
ncbi:unnamed protein product [Thelazia callipaeda]|uniref:CPG4 domain-containing protein n=1 Tax=Thelazia callipaeda TaxID=103827 RepID=A0A0N5CNT4_THECL|nr:unnamed protein product [Thelazia callipaeda]